MGFSRKESWSRLPFPSPGNLPDPGIEPWVSCISRRILYHWATWEALLTAVASYSLPTCTEGKESLSHESLLLQLLQGTMKADFRNFYFFSFDAHCHIFLSFFYICCLFYQLSLFCFLSFFPALFYLFICFYHIAHLFLIFFMLLFLTHVSIKKKIFFLWFYSILFSLSCHSTVLEELFLSQVFWVKPRLCHLLDVWPLARYLFFFCFSIPICKIGINLILP